MTITRLDRLGRSLQELLTTVEPLKEQSTGLISREKAIGTTSTAILNWRAYGVILPRPEQTLLESGD